MTNNKPTAPTQAAGCGVSRRELLLGAGAVLAAAAAGPAGAAIAGHDHSKHSPVHPQLLDATNICLNKGERCIAHCLTSFREGDLELADCAAKVHEMQAICGGFSYLLAASSHYLAQYRGVCETVCKDCAKECRKHDGHIECRQCAEACEAVVEAIGKAFA